MLSRSFEKNFDRGVRLCLALSHVRSNFPIRPREEEEEVPFETEKGGEEEKRPSNSRISSRN